MAYYHSEPKPFWPQPGSYWVVCLLGTLITWEWVRCAMALH